MTRVFSEPEPSGHRPDGSFLGKYRSHVGVLTPLCVMRSEAPPGAEASAPFDTLSERSHGSKEVPGTSESAGHLSSLNPDQVVLTFAHSQRCISLFVTGFSGARTQMSTRPNTR